MSSSVSARLGTLRQHLRRHGIGSAVLLLVLQPLEDRKILRIGRIHASPTATPHLPSPLPSHRLEARFLTQPEIHSLVDAGADWFFPGAVERSLAQGERCFALFVDGEIATTIWYSRGPLRQFGLDLRTDARTVFHHRRYTNPRWRGQGLAGWASYQGRTRLREEGVEWALGTIYATNASSIRQSLKSGGKCIGWIVQFGPDRWRWSLHIPGKRSTTKPAYEFQRSAKLR